jgi:hypothetical protein
MYQKACTIVKKSVFEMLFRRRIYIKLNVVADFELRLIVDIFAKVVQKINQEKNCSFQNV